MRAHNPGSLKKLSTLLALAIILHQPRCGLTLCIWLLSLSISLPSKNGETNLSAPGQQILGLIGDKSDGSARLSNCDGAVSRRKKGLTHIDLPDGRELEKMELAGEAEPGGRSNKAGE